MTNITWKAIYIDNTELLQSLNKYSDIDQSKLAKFALYHGTSLICLLHLNENKHLIYRRRVGMKFTTNQTEVVYLVGWQENVNGREVKTLLFVFEDGHIEVMDKFYKDHSWFYPII